MDSIKQMMTQPKPVNTNQRFDKLDAGILQVINGIKQVIKNQSEIYNLLKNIGTLQASQQTIYKHIRFLTPRQLYFMTKDGYTLDEISLISEYDIETITKKIQAYIQDNT